LQGCLFFKFDEKATNRSFPIFSFCFGEHREADFNEMKLIFSNVKLKEKLQLKQFQ